MFSLSSGFEEFALEHGSRIQRQLQNALMLKYRRQSLYALVRLKEDSPLDPLISHLGEGYGQTQEFTSSKAIPHHNSGARVAQICRVAIRTRFCFKWRLVKIMGSFRFREPERRIRRLLESGERLGAFQAVFPFVLNL